MIEENEREDEELEKIKDNGDIKKEKMKEEIKRRRWPKAMKETKDGERGEIVKFKEDDIVIKNNEKIMSIKIILNPTTKSRKKIKEWKINENNSRSE